jgi:alcohol dehydrogenase
VLGHEALGQITAFGPGASPRDGRGNALAVGDRVSWSVAASCGNCFFCQHDLPQKCEHLFKYGHESCCGARPLSGGMAEFCQLAAGTAIFAVPNNIPDAVASSANCATATVAAAIRAAGGCRGKRILIQGAGLLGLTAAAMAKVDDAEQIVVVDVDPGRLAAARRFGADTALHAVNDSDALADVLQASAPGRGADLILEVSGTVEAIRQGLALLRTGGQYVFIGAVKPIGTVPLDPEQVVRRMWRICGIHNYAPIDLATAIDFLAEHWNRFPFAEMVSAEFSLDHSDAAFQQMVDTGAIRVAVRP